MRHRWMTRWVLGCVGLFGGLMLAGAAHADAGVHLAAHRLAMRGDALELRRLGLLQRAAHRLRPVTHAGDLGRIGADVAAGDRHREREDGEGEGKAGEQAHPPRSLEIGTAIGQHSAPAWNG